MTQDRLAARRRNLLETLHESDSETLLVTNFTNVTYLTGFSGDDSCLLIGSDLAVLISDSRYETQIAEECPGLDVYIRPPKQRMDEAVAEVIRDARQNKVGFESTSTTVDQWQRLRDRLESTELLPVAGVVEKLRMIKDDDEVTAIRQAVDQAQQGFGILRTSLTREMTELQAAHELEHAMRRFGALEASFESIVAVGSRSALPHARPGGQRIEAADFVLIDWGACGPSGYKSDLTRILVTGKISPKLEEVYRVVLNAQRRAIEAIEPGLKCADVDAIARGVIDEAGYGEHFGHGLGHGIGMDIHEGPRLGPSSEDTLQPGMVVTVEPGIYLPEWGGIRIEDDVLVTQNGCEVLTSLPTDLEHAVLS